VSRWRAHLARPPGGGVAVEDPGGTQPDQQLHVIAGQGPGEVGGIVAGIEQDERRRVAGLLLPGRGQVLQQSGDLADRDVGVLLAGPDPARLDGINPGRTAPPDADEHAVGPAGQPAVPALAADLHHGPLVSVLGVGARQRSGVDREHQRLARPGRGQLGDQQPPQPAAADPALGQGIVDRAVSAAELRLHRQLHRRSHRSLRAQHPVGQLEQRIPAPGEAGMQTSAEPG
jgi:hypothetical protein